MVPAVAIGATLIGANGAYILFKQYGPAAAHWVSSYAQKNPETISEAVTGIFNYFDFWSAGDESNQKPKSDGSSDLEKQMKAANEIMATFNRGNKKPKLDTTNIRIEKCEFNNCQITVNVNCRVEKPSEKSPRKSENRQRLQ